MPESIGDLHIALRASADKIASDINAGLNASQGQIQARAVAVGTTISNGISKGLETLKNTIRSAVGMGFEGLDRIDALDEAAAKIGATYNGLQDLKFAAESTGGSFEGMVSALGKMQANISSEKAADALSALRLDAINLRKLAPEKQFAEIAQRLSEIKNTGDKLELTKQIFGKGGVEIMNVINQGKSGLSEMSRIVQALGGHMSDVQVAMVSMANDNMDKLKSGWGFVKDQIAVGIAPVIVALSGYVLKLSEQVGGIGPMVQNWVSGVISFVAGLATAAQVGNVIVSAFQGVGAAIGGIIAVAVQGFKVMVAAMEDSVKSIGSALKMIVYNVESAVVESLNKIIALANKIPKAAGSFLDTVKVAAGTVVHSVAPSADFDTGPSSAALMDLASNPTGGPDSSLFGMLDAPSPPKDMIVDYTNLGAQIDLFKTTAPEAFRVVGDAASETGDKMKDIWDGEFIGDKIRKETEVARVEMEKAAQERVLQTQQTAAQTYDIELANTERLKKLHDEERKARIKAALDAASAIQQANERTVKNFQGMNREVVGDMVTAWATGTGKISDIISQWAGNMLKQFVQLSLFGNGGSFGGLTGMLMGGGGGASILGTVIGGLFGGAHAAGGRPAMGKISMVGEKGPELFVPDSAGTIVPNHKINSFAPSASGQQGGGAPAMESPIIINQSFATGVTHADLAGAMDSVLDQTRNAVAEGVSRGGGFRRSIQR